jgi:hypothetical protein
MRLRKPISPQHEKPRPQVRVQRRGTLQRAAVNSSPVNDAPPILHEALRSPGQPLDVDTRTVMESRFCHDFSQVRVHTDAKAAESAQALDALAYTVGRDVVFGSGQYSPETSAGQNLLAHELAHVVQQGDGKANQIFRWSAATHGDITKEIITSGFKSDFGSTVTDTIAYYSGEMDIRGCNYAWFIGTKTPVIAPVVGYLLDDKEGPNHGEANLYKRSDRTDVNDARMKQYISKAVKLANESGINDQSLLELGLALHVGQDRGAHEEGLPGRGHGREFDPNDPKKKWNPDNPSQNTQGKKVAQNHSKAILRSFVGGLNESAKAGLETATPTKVARGGLEFTSGMALTKGRPQFYAGMSAYGLATEPKRLFGLWSPVLKTGLGVTAGTEQTLSLTGEVGLRLMRITPRIYVDVLGGGMFGYNVTDKNLMAGVTATVQAHYTGEKADLGVMLKNLYDVVGERDVLVIGVSARW